MHAVFRFDASPALGAGHAYRCLTLAAALTELGWGCGGIANPEAAATAPALRDISPLPLIRQDQAADADWLIVDHYGLDAAWETAQRAWAKRILVIDDLADRRHDCDLLLDQTFGRQAQEYDGLVPAGCRRLTGSDYALLRPGFPQIRPAALARRGAAPKLRRILVSLGGTDPENHTVEILKGLAESGLTVGVDVVLGGGAPHLEAVRSACAALPLEVRLHVDTQEMPQLMAAADLAIGAAGTSTWERCCLGLPSLLVTIADNQRRIAAAVSTAGGGRRLPGPLRELRSQVAAALQELAVDPRALQRLSAAAAALCDGRGAERVVAALLADLPFSHDDHRTDGRE